jgi:glycosyltransferase involved in cell wall biosynthesis
MSNEILVAIISPIYPPPFGGGGLRSVSLLAEQLDANCNIEDVTVFSFDGGSNENINGVSINRLGNIPSRPFEISNIYSYFKLKDLKEYDIVHSYNMIYHPTIGILSEKFGIPSVATLNSYVYLPKKRINLTPGKMRSIYEKTILSYTRSHHIKNINKMDKIIKLSNSIGDIYEEFGLDSQKMTKIPNMIDPDILSQKSINHDHREENNTNLLFVGELRDSKGVRYLIDAVSELPEDYQLNIYGSGEQISDLKSKVDNQDLTNCITFHGHVEYAEIHRAYLNSDVFVHPGIWPEPFNRTLLEAMQFGLPIVTTDIGGPPEVIPQNELICEPGNSAELALSIRKATREHGKENRQEVKKYHPDTVINKIIELYKDIL